MLRPTRCERVADLSASCFHTVHTRARRGQQQSIDLLLFCNFAGFLFNSNIPCNVFGCLKVVTCANVNLNISRGSIYYRKMLMTCCIYEAGTAKAVSVGLYRLCIESGYLAYNTVVLNVSVWWSNNVAYSHGLHFSSSACRHVPQLLLHKHKPLNNKGYLLNVVQVFFIFY